MLAAALVVVGATIDYQTVAKPLPEVLKELSAISGVEMRATEALVGERLVIRVGNAHLDTLRNKIASAVYGKWQKKEETFILSLDEVAAKNQERLEIDKRIGYFAERTRELKVKSGEPETGPWEWIKADADAGDQLLGQVLERIDLEALVRLKFWDSVTFSDQPTQMQMPLLNASGILATYLNEHNSIAKALQEDMPVSQVGSPENQGLKSAAKTWKGPLRTVVKCLKGTDFVHVECSIYDSTGDRVANPSTTLSGRRLFKLPDDLPEFVQSNPIPISDVAREFARLFASNNQVLMRDGSFKVSDEAFAVFSTPAKNDPLKNYVSESIIGFANGTGMQIVAAVDERMISHLQSEVPTLGQVASSLFYSDDVIPTLEDNWLIVSRSQLPFDGYNYKVLQRLFEAGKSRTLTLSEMMEFFDSTPPPAVNQLAYIYSSVLLHDSMMEADLETSLTAFGALSASQRNKLIKGEKLTFSSLSAEARAVLQKCLFFRNNNSGELSGSYIERNPFALVMLWSDIVPNGIPPQAVISLTSSSQPFAIPVPKGEGRLSGSITSPRTMAMYATTKMTGPIPQYDNFWVGERIAYALRITVSPDVTMILNFYENKVALGGEEYNIQTAPKDFKDAYDSAVRDRIRMQGGG